MSFSTEWRRSWGGGGGVPPENIWNYDETNLTDDPGAKKAIFKRGVKYAEQIRNHSKSAISMMFCENAAGDMVPPYIVFKAENLWKGWCLNGPKGSRYNTSPSGWFKGLSTRTGSTKAGYQKSSGGLASMC